MSTPKKLGPGRRAVEAPQGPSWPKPPDPARCQAEIPNGHSFLTLGGQPGRTRCARGAVVIVAEKKVGGDGYRGIMSLCSGCLEAFEQQVGRDGHTFWRRES